jgi:ABC-2 type transport system permease protein
MHKLWVVFSREYAQVVKKKSFVIGLFLTPVIMSVFILLPSFLARMKSSETERLAIIDQSGYDIGHGFAEALAEYTLEDEETPYYAVEQIFDLSPDAEDEFDRINDSLRTLVTNKDLKYFLVVKPGVEISDSNVFLVTNSDNFRSLNRFEDAISNEVSTIRLRTSEINLTIDSVLVLTEPVDLATRDTKGESIPFQIKYFAALIFVGIMFGMIIGYGQMVMRSVIEEKNSRIMEVLVSSVTPFQLMLGKILGLGAATMTQVGIWFAAGVIMYASRGSLDVDPAIERIAFDPIIITFFVLFQIAGYLLYSTLFALIGSIVNSEKEAASFIAPITIFMMLPFVLGISVVQEPNSTMATVLSMIPFTAPTMTMMRLVFVVPTLTEFSLFSGIVGEAVLSLLSVTITLVGMVWLTAKIFRIGILMYGKRPTLPELMKWIKY